MTLPTTLVRLAATAGNAVVTPGRTAIGVPVGGIDTAPPPTPPPPLPTIPPPIEVMFPAAPVDVVADPPFPPPGSAVSSLVEGLEQPNHSKASALDSAM